MRKDDSRGAVFDASLEPEKMVTLEEIARAYVEDVLEVLGGNKAAAAKTLGIDRRTLYRRLEKARRA